MFFVITFPKLWDHPFKTSGFFKGVGVKIVKICRRLKWMVPTYIFLMGVWVKGFLQTITVWLKKTLKQIDKKQVKMPQLEN